SFLLSSSLLFFSFLHFLLSSFLLPFFFLLIPPPPSSTLFPYTTLFRSSLDQSRCETAVPRREASVVRLVVAAPAPSTTSLTTDRSEEHTSELQSPYDLVCRLLLEKKKKKQKKKENKKKKKNKEKKQQYN